MKRKMFSVLVLSMVVLFIFTGCSGKEDTFKVGLEAGYAPFNWTQLDDANGGVQMQDSKEFAGGFDVEIAKRIADGLGKELEIVKMDWEGLVPALESGVVDAIIAGMSPTADRKEVIDFSDNYYNSELVMIVKSGGEYQGAKELADFDGATVTAQQNTFHYTVIDQINGVNKETAMGDFPSMRVALESGIIDAYVSERPEGISASRANENFHMVELEDGFEASDEDIAVAVGLKKDGDLLEDINQIINEITEEERVEIMDDAVINQPAAE